MVSLIQLCALFMVGSDETLEHLFAICISKIFWREISELFYSTYECRHLISDARHTRLVLVNTNQVTNDCLPCRWKCREQSVVYGDIKFWHCVVSIGSRDAKSNEMKYPVLLVECVRKIHCEFNSHLASRDKKKLAGYMQKLGFDDISAIFYNLKSETEKKVNHSPINALILWFYSLKSEICSKGVSISNNRLPVKGTLAVWTNEIESWFNTVGSTALCSHDKREIPTRVHGTFVETRGTNRSRSSSRPLHPWQLAGMLMRTWFEHRQAFATVYIFVLF